MTRRILMLVPFVLLGFVLSLAAQNGAQDTPQSGGASEKKDKKQKKDAAAQLDASEFDERVASEVLGRIRDGLESRSQRKLLSAFDGDKMQGFLTFEDEIDALFSRYEGFRVNIRIIQTSVDNNRGAVLAEFQLEGTPRGGGQVSRREGQLRFEMERGAKGWKIVDFTPREFFS